MKYVIFTLVTAVITFSSFFAQEAEKKEQKSNIKYSSKNIGSTQAVEGNVIFSDGTNPLIRITDEGDFGTIQMSNGIPSNTIFKLYNDNGTLYFNGNALGSSNSLVDSLGDLSDAKTDFSSIFVGREAGLNDDGGLSDGNTNNNAAFGKSALKSNTSGSSNTSIGNSSLLNNITGIGNVAVGTSSLGFNTSGFNNIAIGVRSLYLNSTGYFNVGIGYQVGYYNQEGINNTFLGTEAGKGQGPHSKSGSVFIGHQAGFNEVNDNKLYINNDSSSNPLIWGDFTDGSERLKINGDFHVTGNITTDGIVLGPTELNDLTDAKFDGESLFLGEGAGVNDDAGASDGSENYNLGVGKNALTTNISGSRNSALGSESLPNNITGSRNTTVGHTSMFSNTSGNANVALGFQSNYFNETGENNTLIGTRAGYGLASNSFSGNVFIGYQAGYNEISSDKLYIENTDSDTPLIWGDFLMDQVRVNGSFEATTKIVTPKIKLRTGASEGHVLTSDTDGNATWQKPTIVSFLAHLTNDKLIQYHASGDTQFEDFVEDYDEGNVFNPATGEFTPTADGLYQLIINVTSLEFNSTDHRLTLKVKKNGQFFPGSVHDDQVLSENKSISFYLTTNLAANDVISIWIDGYAPSIPVGAGNSFKIAGGNSNYSSTFSGFKIN